MEHGLSQGQQAAEVSSVFHPWLKEKEAMSHGWNMEQVKAGKQSWPDSVLKPCQSVANKALRPQGAKRGTAGGRAVCQPHTGLELVMPQNHGGVVLSPGLEGQID